MSLISFSSDRRRLSSKTDRERAVFATRFYRECVNIPDQGAQPHASRDSPCFSVAEKGNLYSEQTVVARRRTAKRNRRFDAERKIDRRTWGSDGESREFVICTRGSRAVDSTHTHTRTHAHNIHTHARTRTEIV